MFGDKEVLFGLVATSSELQIAKLDQRETEVLKYHKEHTDEILRKLTHDENLRNRGRVAEIYELVERYRKEIQVISEESLDDEDYDEKNL